MANGHGSDIQETPEWWQASDGRWYPPELHPDYRPPAPPTPAAPAAPPAAAPPAAGDASQSLSERLRAAADRVGDEVSAAADEVGDAADAHADSVGPAPAPMSPATEVAPVPPSSPPPAAPPGAPPAAAPPGAPPPMPASPPPPTGPPAVAAPSDEPKFGEVQAGPGGIIYTAPPDEDLSGSFAGSPSGLAMPPSAPAATPPQPPGVTGAPPIGAPPAGAPAPVAPATYPPGAPQGVAPPPGAAYAPADAASAPTKRSSPLAGVIALVGGIAAVAGSFLQWGTGSVDSAAGVERAVIEVAGFDSNGVLTAICGVVLIGLALMFFTGAARQLYCAIAAFVAGGVIVGAVVFSMIDIADLSDRYAVEWEATGLAEAGDLVTTEADIGLWVAGVGGVLGVLSAPFADRR